MFYFSEIGNKEFTVQDAVASKTYARFLVSLTELSPSFMQKHIVSIIKHIDSEVT